MIRYIITDPNITRVKNELCALSINKLRYSADALYLIRKKGFGTNLSLRIIEDINVRTIKKHITKANFTYRIISRWKRGSHTSDNFKRARLINFIWNNHDCKIIFIIWLFKCDLYRLQRLFISMKIWRRHGVTCFRWKRYVTCVHSIIYDITLSTEWQ